MESILKIDKITFTHQYDEMEGFEIQTTNQTIKIGISSHQDCCEDWDYLLCEFPEDVSYIGSEIFDIKLDEKSEQTTQVIVDAREANIDKQYPFSDADGWKRPTLEQMNEDEWSTLTLSIYTDCGILVILLYNIHNGYYPHTYYLKYNDKEDYGEL